jgi:hypothetical protein
MNFSSLFNMPKPMKITGRSSSITNAFINSIIPVIHPSEEEIKTALEILEMTPDNFQCIYCGAVSSEWDHLRPLVKNKKPTGFISEIHNLVPSCGKCNQSKGNKEWEAWMLSSAKLSPKTKGVPDLADRIRRLKKYEKWNNPTKINFEGIVGKEVMAEHWENCEKVQSIMRESQILAEEINANVAKKFNKNLG